MTRRNSSVAFRRAVIKHLLSKSQITEEFASTLLCWNNSGFSVDNKVRIDGDDHTTRVALAQYIARAPLSLVKLSYLPDEATVRYSSTFNPALGDSTKMWNVRDFIADATSFIPPQGVRLIITTVCIRPAAGGAVARPRPIFRRFNCLRGRFVDLGSDLQDRRRQKAESARRRTVTGGCSASAVAEAGGD